MNISSWLKQKIWTNLPHFNTTFMGNNLSRGASFSANDSCLETTYQAVWGNDCKNDSDQIVFLNWSVYVVLLTLYSPVMPCDIILLILFFICYNFLGWKGLTLSIPKNAKIILCCSIWRTELKVWCQMASRDWKGLRDSPIVSTNTIRNASAVWIFFGIEGRWGHCFLETLGSDYPVTQLRIQEEERPYLYTHTHTHTQI
jgi:hypothetical protein